MVRKRERENPCAVCGHYHKFEDGEVCGVCGHRLQDAGERSHLGTSAFSSEILPSFLYLGSYDNASRAELLKAQGISRILNTVPTCQNLYKNSFVYKTIQADQKLPFDECVEFIEQSRLDNARVLVHCMSGQSRSPAVAIAYLMRHKGWRLPQSFQWVKDRRPSVNLSQAVLQQLQAYESEIFGSSAAPNVPVPPPENGTGFCFGFPQIPTPTVAAPLFSSSSTSLSSSSATLFGSASGLTAQNNFVFGAGKEEQEVTNAATDNTMDSS